MFYLKRATHCNKRALGGMVRSSGIMLKHKMLYEDCNQIVVAKTITFQKYKSAFPIRTIKPFNHLFCLTKSGKKKILAIYQN